MDRNVNLQTNAMSVTKQPMLLLRQSVRPERVKPESQPELVRLLVELLVQKLKRERADKPRK
jgi:hypothetical protein